MSLVPKTAIQWVYRPLPSLSTQMAVVPGVLEERKMILDMRFRRRVQLLKQEPVIEHARGTVSSALKQYRK